MTGKMKYLKKDKVCPVDWPITIMTTGIIAVPSLFTLIYTSFKLCGKIGGWFLSAAYLVSFVNLLRIHHLCRVTEPGILPRIRSKRIDYNKTYYCKYRSPGDILDEFKNEDEKD